MLSSYGLVGEKNQVIIYAKETKYNVHMKYSCNYETHTLAQTEKYVL